MRDAAFFRLAARLERYELENFELYLEIREWRELVQYMAESARARHRDFQAVSASNSLYLAALRSLPREIQALFWAAVAEREYRREGRNGAANLHYLPSEQGA